MINKTIIGALVAVAVVGTASFYSGMSYAKSSQNISARGQFANGMGGMRGNTRGGGGFTSGQILSVDTTSATIKTQDGSTKIVLLASSTQVMKTASGARSDLTVGETVSVTGPSNSDGSVTAQNIQIRPAGMGGFGPRGMQ